MTKTATIKGVTPEKRVIRIKKVRKTPKTVDGEVKKPTKKPKKEIKDTKVVINLTKTSQNWLNLKPKIPPKVQFKRQQAKKPLLQPNAPNGSKKDTLQSKPETNGDDKKPKIWFDVDKIFLNPDDLSTNKSLANDKDGDEPKEAVITKAIAIDCEMVGVGEDGRDSILARCSLVNHHGECIYDKYVIPTDQVTDYRTHVSGIRPADLKKENNAIEFKQVQADVASLIKNKILVGHAIQNDLKILFLSHDKKYIRDTQKCKLFRRLAPNLGGLPSLKNLAKTLLAISIQENEHSSVQDAQATMKLYTTYKKDWEAEVHKRQKPGGKDDKKLVYTANKISETKSDIEIKTGNTTHKRYLQNKLKKRNNKLNFLKKK
jgi:RNA exonuclease 4